MVNAFTVDVEDYYSVFSRDRLGRDTPPTEAVVRNTHRVLSLLAERGVTATFFVLGEVAETFPRLLRDIVAGGHEMGVHGMKHHQVFKLSREAFARQVAEGKARVEEASGVAVIGHRAPAFSIMPRTAWALEVLAEQGYLYDASIFPIRRRVYGWPGFPPDIREMTLPSGARLIEAPMSHLRVLGKAIPGVGGGYLRRLPYAYARYVMKRVQRRRPAIVYMHPYEVDPDPAPASFAEAVAVAGGAVRKFHARQLRHRATVERKLRRLLAEFAFAPLRDVIAQALGRAVTPPPAAPEGSRTPAPGPI